MRLSKNIWRKTSQFGCISWATSRTGPVHTGCRGTPGRGNIWKNPINSTDRYSQESQYARWEGSPSLPQLGTLLAITFRVFISRRRSDQFWKALIELCVMNTLPAWSGRAQEKKNRSYSSWPQLNIQGRLYRNLLSCRYYCYFKKYQKYQYNFTR